MEQEQPISPVEPRGFIMLARLFADAGIARWLTVGDARRALRALCAEADTERERYRQQTIEQAREDGEE